MKLYEQRFQETSVPNIGAMRALRKAVNWWAKDFHCGHLPEFQEVSNQSGEEDAF